MPAGSRVLDAGAGQAQYAHYFAEQHYTGVDLAVGDATWDYGRLQAIADLTALPFAPASFDACINIVTLEHVREPGRAVKEMGRVLKRGGSLLLAVPHEWEVHQAPHDYFRFTRHGIQHLLEQAGFQRIRIDPVGGFFRLLSRRLLSGLQFFPAPLVPVAALFLAPPALILPLFDFLDRERNLHTWLSMHGKKILLILWASLALAGDFSGASALEVHRQGRLIRAAPARLGRHQEAPELPGRPAQAVPLRGNRGCVHRPAPPWGRWP